METGAICHGLIGRGDGPIAAYYTPKPANFTDSKLIDPETDGSLFWKITTGRDPMPAWGPQLSEAHRW
jgi:mono/diheme cytochrome c family protein